MKVEPLSGSLSTFNSPPRVRVISRLIDRPRPVPPYLRLVVPSACWKASKMIRCLSSGMPMPLSHTEKASTWPEVFRCSLPGLQPLSTRFTLSLTSPAAVNLKALDSRFLMICCSRLSSVYMAAGRAGSRSIRKPSFLSWAIWAKVRSIWSRRESKRVSPMSRVTVPDSIFDRSRMSLISPSRSEPAAWMFLANSTCLPVRLPWVFSLSIFDRISRLFSGVRSSWLILARNSDLYFDVRASCSAFSSSAKRACSTSKFLASTCLFWADSRTAFSSSSALDCCSSSCLARSSSSDWRRLAACCSSRSLVIFSSSCCAWSSAVSSWDWLSSPSVRMLAAMVLSTMPTDSISWLRNDWWVSENSPKVASSITALTSPSNRAGRMMMFSGAAPPRPEPIWT